VARKAEMAPSPVRRPYYVIAQGLIRALAHLFLGYRVWGVENVPREGGFLLASSHKSYLDPMVVGACLPRELRYFSKRELFANPLFGRLIRSYGAVPVDRAGADRRALTVALDILRDGQGLIVFPEGTRIRRPGVGEAKSGVGMLAVRSGVPVVPVWAGSTWAPRRSLRRRVPVRVRFGTPLCFAAPAEPAGARRAYQEAASLIMAAIARLGEEDAKFPG
jgi:1-acyl-sn-glycerol-3-phosphate acyltransferase